MHDDVRMSELDVLRGLAVAVMILVVSPGAWEFTYAQLQHADWHGWSLADLVFPDFLFGVGMALGLTFGRSLDPAAEGHLFRNKVARRVIGLILLGLALNYLFVIAGRLGAQPVGPDDVTPLRIPGVLQRIALCYLLAVVAVLLTARRDEAGAWRPNPWGVGAVIAGILVTYWVLLAFVPVPGFGSGDLGKAGNLAAYIDRAVFTPRHMWPLGAASWRGPVLYDPEGLLSTLPATANVLFGVLAVGIWRDRPRGRLGLLLAAGLVLIAGGLLLDSVFPINKKLWTSSFALLTSGFSCLALLVVGVVVRFDLGRRLLAPFRILGGNALLAFSISIFLSALASIPFPLAGGPKTLQRMGFDVASLVITNPHIASFACALAVLAFIVLLLLPLHKRRIHVRL